ncbi:protein SCO1 homolog 2, mitochondrial-like [Salvia splendens]|uniref:protein SCO1 homolog 2, mitochondrial-like n=1 Tax=Salvia splendens TaxID=180675 RepID=UPI001C2638C0|nr:protein SCO1 homolog 2, mitochondrial-like [Salvia splendens]XP_042026442.1 protein SCO1 homolog 2, mitochondrial-like [Salvia splendens]
MPLLSRGVFAAISHAESSLEAFKRSGLSKIFFSSMSRRPSLNNLSSHPLTEQIMVADHEGLFRLNCFTKYGLSKRYYCSKTKSTNSVKTSPLPEQAGTNWRSFLIPGLALTGIGGLLFLFHHNDQRRVVLKGKGVKFERSANHGPIIGGPFSLINTEDRRVTEKNLLGNWVLLYFGYTSSPDVGPSELRKMANTINILESKQNIKVLPIFVTIDPQRDTPSHLRAYIHEFDSRIVGLTGPVTAIRQMAQEYRVFFRKVDEQGSDYLIESSHNIYLLNPGMEVSRSFGLEYNAGELSEAIAKEIKKSAITEARS